MSNKTESDQLDKASTQGRVPKLRFPEFLDSPVWESKKLEEIASFYKGKGISKADVDQKGRIPCIRYGELYTHYNEVIDSIFSKTNLPESELFFSCQNDVIIPSSGETKLDIATASCLMFDDVALGGDINVIRCNQNGVFISYYLNSWKRFEIAKIAQGDSVVHLYSSQLKQLDVTLPSHSEQQNEQQKIADCLSSIDELIIAQGQKLDTLKAHKKGLMQQLFPAEGETVPKLRFPEFRDAENWEGKKLGQIGDVFMCKRIFAEETNEIEGIPFFKIGTLGGKPDAFISRKLFDEYKSKYNFPRKGEILITCSGTVGKCLPYNGENTYYQDSNIVWIDNPTLEIRNDLLHNLLSNVNWGKLNSTTITRIYGYDLRNLFIKFPKDQKEQQKIADCFSIIDELIAAHSQKLDTLKAHKKGLMQQLFPAEGEYHE